MTRVINQIDHATAQRIRDAIAGKPQLRAAKPKRAQPVKCYVSQYWSYDPRRDRYTLQLPIAFDPRMYNAGRTPQYLRERYVKQLRETTWSACFALIHNFDRERLKHIEFVRIAVNKMDSDNVQSAFKAIRDALCTFIVHGRNCVDHVKTIGHADNKLEQEGVTWSYRQQQCESNPRLFGVRIILHCAPRSSE